MMGGTVHGDIGEPATLDPQLTSESEGFEVMRLVFDGLTLYDPAGGAVIPGVAESWEANADNTVWTFHLRDTTFSDGTPLTAEDFVTGFNRLADPDLASGVSYHGSLAGIVGWDEVQAEDVTGKIGDQPVAGLKAIDPLTLEITLNNGLAFLPKIVAHPAFSPVSSTSLDADGNWIDPDMPIGNGPYKMREPWQHQVSITLDRNDSYWGTPGNPDTVEFTIFADTVVAGWQAFLDGQLDVHTVAAENLDQATQLYGQVNEVNTGSFGYLGFPTQTPPYDNPEMRKALVMAVDREAIATRILKRAVANGFVPPVATGSVDGLDSCPACKYDPAAAKTLFDSLGGIPGNKVTISFNAGGGHEDWIGAVANDWTTNLGLEVDFNTLEWAAYLEFLGLTGGPPATQPFRLGWGWDYPSAYNFLAPLYLSTSGDNYTKYNNPDFDALMHKAEQAATEDDAIPFLEEAQLILGEEVPVMPMTYGFVRWVKNDNVDHVRYNDFGFFLWEEMTVNQ